MEKTEGVSPQAERPQEPPSRLSDPETQKALRCIQNETIPTAEQAPYESYTVMLTNLIEDPKQTQKNLSSLQQLLELDLSHRDLFLKARKAFVLTIGDEKKTAELWVDGMIDQSSVSPEQGSLLPTDDGLQSFLMIYLRAKGLYPADELVRNHEDIQEGLLFLKQYKQKKGEFEQASGKNISLPQKFTAYLDPVFLLAERNKVISGENIQNKPNIAALTNHLQETEIVHRILTYPLDFRNFYEIATRTGYDTFSKEEVSTLLVYLELLKQTPGHLEPIEVTAQGKPSSISQTLTLQQFIEQDYVLTQPQEVELVEAINTFRAVHKKTEKISDLPQEIATIDRMISGLGTPDVATENIIEEHIKTLHERLARGHTPELTSSYNLMIRNYLTYLQTYRFESHLQIMRTMHQHIGDQAKLFTERAMGKFDPDRERGGRDVNSFPRKKLVEEYMWQTDLSSVPLEELTHGIATPFVDYITTQHSLSNASDPMMTDPSSEKEKNAHLLYAQTVRYKEAFSSYTLLERQQSRLQLSNERSRRFFGNLLDVLNNTIGDGDEQANFYRPSTKAELLEAWAPRIATELAKRYEQASSTEKPAIKDACIAFAAKITAPEMRDGNTDFRQDETAFALLGPIVQDDLGVNATIEKVTAKDIWKETKTAYSLPNKLGLTDTIIHLQSSLSPEQQPLFAEYVSILYPESLDKPLESISAIDLLTVVSLYTACKSFKDGESKESIRDRAHLNFLEHVELIVSQFKVTLPEPLPKSVQLMNETYQRLDARKYFDTPTIEVGMKAGTGLFKTLGKRIKQMFSSSKTNSVNVNGQPFNIVLKNGSSISGTFIKILMGVGIGVAGTLYVQNRRKKLTSLDTETESTTDPLTEEEKGVEIQPPVAMYEIILGEQKMKKTSRTVLKHTYEMVEGDNMFAKIGNKGRQALNWTLNMLEKNEDIIDLTVAANLQVRCDQTKTPTEEIVDYTIVYQTLPNGKKDYTKIDWQKCTFTFTPPPFYLDAQIKLEDFGNNQNLKIVQRKEAWNSNEEMRSEAINHGFVQYFLRMVGQDHSDPNNPHADPEIGAGLEELISMAEKRYMQEVIASTRDQYKRMPGYTEIPDENFQFDFSNNTPEKLRRYFYERLTSSSDEYKEMFKYIETTDPLKN